MNSSSQVNEVKIESTLHSPVHLTPNQRAWRRFLHNRPAVFSSFFLITMVLLILIWPLLSKPRIAIHLPKAMTQDTVVALQAMMHEEYGDDTVLPGRHVSV